MIASRIMKMHRGVSGEITGTNVDVSTEFVSFGEYLNTSASNNFDENTTAHYSVSEIQVSHSGSGRLYIGHKTTSTQVYMSDAPIAAIQVLDNAGTSVLHNFYFGVNDQGWKTTLVSHTQTPNNGILDTTPTVARDAYSFGDISTVPLTDRFCIASGTPSAQTGAANGISLPSGPMTLGEATIMQFIPTNYVYRETSSTADSYASFMRSPIISWSAGMKVRVAYIIGNSSSFPQQVNDSLFMGIASPPAFSATGGTITTVGAYTIHTFTTSGTFTAAASGDIDVLIVGGGGGGGSRMGGGGGAGAVYHRTAYAVTAGSNAIVIGSGGAGGWHVSGAGVDGSTTTAFSVSATGGGGGGHFGTTSAGSGANGGGSNNGYAGGTGTLTTYTGWTGYGGNDGGGSATVYHSSAGGGGATADGVANDGSGGGKQGGAGVLNDINGSALYWAGGGGGSSWNVGDGGDGGIGGGGAGGAGSGAGGLGGAGGTSALNAGAAGGSGNSTPGGAAGENTGSGGGGGTYVAGAGGVGGSGIVIVRYLT